MLDAAVLLDSVSGFDEQDPTSLGTRQAQMDGDDGSKVIPQLLGNESSKWTANERLEGLLDLHSSPHSLRGLTIGVPREFHTLELDPRIHQVCFVETTLR